MLRSRRATILPQCRHGSEPELIHEATAASHGAAQRESARARARARERERERERERGVPQQRHILHLGAAKPAGTPATAVMQAQRAQ
jgi:hypothetical protein